MVLNQIVTVVFFVVLFIVTYFYLKPLRLHNANKYSTLTLKFSYLLYLVIAMVSVYMFMFYRNKTMFNLDFSVTSGIVYFLIGILIVAFIVPTLGILIRRKVRHRSKYNVVFSFINIFCIVIFLVMLFISQWGSKIMYSE